MNLSRAQLRKHIQNFDLTQLFVDLGWNRFQESFTVAAAGQDWQVEAVAEKASFGAYVVRVAKGRKFPDSSTRRAIEKQVARRRREHLICYYDEATGAQTWQWVRREAGKPVNYRDLTWLPGDRGDLLLEKLERLYVSIEDEERGLTVLDIASRADVAARADKVTKKFYDTFKKQHDAFKDFIEGIGHAGDLDWYTSLMLNRLMFIYFLQRRGFLDNDRDYLRNRLLRIQERSGKNKFHSFYRSFLLVLFHQGLGGQDRPDDLIELIGKIPYLNGGLFDIHKLETENPKIEIPDSAFEKLFEFFDQWDWHLDERPLRNQNEINPDVLGYIFEKYINQKQMGAYYTKEDITEYITRSTVLPRLVTMMRERCKVAFEGESAVWHYLAEDPDRYIFPAVRHGISINWKTGEPLDTPVPLPDDIAAGLDDIPSRTGWNRRAPEDAALPTETWREVIARRRRHDEVREKLATGGVTSIEDFITLNLDIRQFLQDVIERAEGPHLLDAAWQSLTTISILDPTCGSGAFLFAALNVLEPLYEGTIERMDALVAEWRRAHPNQPLPTGNTHMARFVERLKDLARHPSQRYFVLKTIVLQNLYGVDIMEEAVEICKLRLFLKLVAQLESADQIEPLPDLDFNVRAGNTLVGFATEQQARDAITSDIAEAASWPGIQYAAQQASGTFTLFREAQADPNANADHIREWKRLLNEQLQDLRNQLDAALARQHGIDDPAAKPKKFATWRESHQPFHWFVEFYGILHDGGFDAIIGNPPYVEYSKRTTAYDLGKYALVATGNLFSMVFERSTHLCRPIGVLGLIVPLSSTSTPRMFPLMEFAQRNFSKLWVSNFAVRPGKLFVGVDMNLSVWIAHKNGFSSTEQSDQTMYSTRYTRWQEEYRHVLFTTLAYGATYLDRVRKCLPKIGNLADRRIYDILTAMPTIGTAISAPGHKTQLYYHSGGRYFRKCVTEKHSVEYKALDVPVDLVPGIQCFLSSILYYWYWQTVSDCYHVVRDDVLLAPFPPVFTNVVLADAHRVLLQAYADAKVEQTRQRADGRIQLEVQYDMPRVLARLSDMDSKLVELLPLLPEEQDELKAFELKYRKGTT